MFCVKSGHVYEKRLITKHVEQTGRDPVTQDEVTAADLVPVRNNKLSKPRPVGASSVGGMLSLLQNEYDALLLEGFQLRQELESTRQELSQALYQHDAACRVIARLVKERDAARIALVQTQAAMAQRLAQLPAAAAAADVEMAGGGGGDSNAAAAAGGITEVVVALIKDKNKEFSKARKKRSVPTDTATTEAVASLTLAHSYSHHTSSAPGVLAMDALPLPSSALFAPPSSSASNGLPSHVLTGGADASALLLELPSSASDAPATAAGAGRVTARLKGHAKPVTSVAIVPGGHVGNSESVGAFVTGSADATVRIWGHKQGSAEWSSTAVLRSHRDAVTSVSLHPSLPYVATTSRDGTWAFADVTAGRSLYTHDVVDEAVAAGSSGDLRGFTCGSIHPDGAIYGVGCADRAVRVFDLREQVSGCFYKCYVPSSSLECDVWVLFANEFVALIRGFLRSLISYSLIIPRPLPSCHPVACCSARWRPSPTTVRPSPA